MHPTPSLLSQVDAIDPDSGLVNVVIDKPRGSRCKYKFDPKTSVLRLGKLLPTGGVVPWTT
jgi:inorganic pyrophosphatase